LHQCVGDTQNFKVYKSRSLFLQRLLQNTFGVVFFYWLQSFI